MSSFTARQIVELISRNMGVAPQDDTVDTFKSGDEETLVQGIAVTMMPTLEVLQHAAERRHNFVIAHEPAFYGHQDETAQLEREKDEVWVRKRDFIARHNLVLWRFHDAPHLAHPDMILSGMTDELGWRAFQNPQDNRLFRLPTTTLGDLAQQIRDTLGIRCLRVVGDETLEASRVALSPGFPGFESQRQLLQNPDVEVLVMGEAHEWETIAYAADAGAAGLRKALLVLGHIPSEQGGMKAITRQLQALLPQLPVEFIATPEPFWTPRF